MRRLKQIKAITMALTMLPNLLFNGSKLGFIEGTKFFLAISKLVG